MRIADVTRDTTDIRILFHKGMVDHILLFLIRLKRNIILQIAPGVIRVVLPQMIGLDPQKDIHIRQTLCTEIPGLLPAPELGAEVPVKADGEPLCLCRLQGTQDKLRAVLRQRRRDPAQMQPGIAFQQAVHIHL